MSTVSFQVIQTWLSSNFEVFVDIPLIKIILFWSEVKGRPRFITVRVVSYFVKSLNLYKDHFKRSSSFK